jgi:uncharacterized protein (TIRG00374 family)
MTSSQPQPVKHPRGAARKSSWSRGVRDWRIWLGVFVTIICIWLAVRGIPFSEVANTIGKVNFGLLFLLSAPFYALNIWIRALRWRHLTNSVMPIPRRLLYRSTAIGFMLNNLLPLRIGEFARCWTLSHESGAPLAAVVGTVVLERVLDLVAFLLLTLCALALVGMESDSGGMLADGSAILLPLALLPLAVLIALKMFPDFVLRVVTFVLRIFPTRFAEFVDRTLHSFISGIGALSTGRHLYWIIFHSVVLWLVLATAPLLVTIWVFEVDLGSPGDTLLTAWVLLGAIGAAVALPSSPGFFGPYQLAFTAVLVHFGVDQATSFSMGILAWAVFWITYTVQGALAFRTTGLKLSQVRASQD